MMNSLFNRSLYWLFLAALFVPMAAALHSPKIREVVSSTIADPTQAGVQKEILRRTTPLWNKAVESYSRVLYKLGTSNASNIAVVGKDGWVFLGNTFNNNLAQAMGRRYYNEGDIDAWNSALLEQQKWLAHRGIPLLFVVAPAKWSVYPDKLPDWAQNSRHKHIFDQLLESRSDLPFIDLRPSLRDARSIADTYSPFDSHWDGFGAYIAWKNIVPALAHKDPRFASLFIPQLVSTASRNQGNEFAAMISLNRRNPWIYPVFDKPMPQFAFVGADGHEAPQPGERQTDLLELPQTTRNHSTNNKLKALVLRDSMGNALSPYLQAAFYETYQARHFIDNQALAPNIPDLVKGFKPDVVIYVMTERHFDNILASGSAWKAANALDEPTP